MERVRERTTKHHVDLSLHIMKQSIIVSEAAFIVVLV